MDQLLDTPSLVVDLHVMDAHIKRMQNVANKKKLRLRPHIKTHKSPYIAKLQLQHGASGITCATLGEAEVMCAHGISNILIAYPIVGNKKLQRLAKIVEKAEVIVSLDHMEVAKGLNEVGEKVGKIVPVYIEVDTGLGRVGLTSTDDVIKLVSKLQSLPFIKIVGLMSHSGNTYTTNVKEEIIYVSRNDANILVQTKLEVKEKLGVLIPEISIGSTPATIDDAVYEHVTEMRPGTYVFNDATLLSQGIVTEKDCALTICATVVSTPTPYRFIIDAGSKTLTKDTGTFTKGYGFIKGSTDMWVSWLSEEHGVVNVQEKHPYKVGDRLSIIPNHVCPTVNLVDQIIGIRNGKIEKKIQVEARGKIQ